MLKCNFVGTMDVPQHWQKIRIGLIILGYFPQKLTETFMKARDTRPTINRLMWACAQAAKIGISHHHIFYLDCELILLTHMQNCKKKTKNPFSPGYCYMKIPHWNLIITHFQCNEKSSHTAPPFPSTQDLCRTLFPLENINCKCICEKERDEQSWEKNKTKHA